MKNTWITLSIIVVLLALSIIIDIPKGPDIFGREIKTRLGLDLQGEQKSYIKPTSQNQKINQKI